MKIFIIDDEQVSVFILRHKLMEAGVAANKDIVAFLSAKEALSALLTCTNEELPEVVFLDLSMPEMDGWQFLDAIAPSAARFKENCRIFILTSSLALSDSEKLKEYPFVAGLIRKPINTEEILMIDSKQGGIPGSIENLFIENKD